MRADDWEPEVHELPGLLALAQDVLPREGGAFKVQQAGWAAQTQVREVSFLSNRLATLQAEREAAALMPDVKSVARN